MTETRTRTIQLDRKASRGDSFPVVAATETPVRRHFGYEVLDMSRMDLSRCPFPVIESHNQNALNIGLFEDARIEDGKLRGSIRLGTSARAKEVAEDIRGGIVRNVSVGYEVRDPIEDGEIDGEPVFRFASNLLELSLVAAPADPNSGIYRSKGTTTMETEKQYTDEELRTESIRQAAERFDLQELGRRAIDEKWSVQRFNDAALGIKGEESRNARQYETRGTEQPRQHQTPNHYMAAGMPCDNTKYGRAMEQYSVVKLMRSLSDPRRMSEAGLELEISQDMQRVLGRSTKGILVPFEALQAQRAVTYSGTSGASVATDHLSASFIDVLRNRSMVMKLGPTVLRGLVGNVDIPRKTSGASAYWIAGDNADSITESDLTLDQVSLTPKTVGGAVTFSHRMIVQSSPDIEQMVRQDLADLIGTEIDAKAINGSGSANQPLGIIGTTGINAKDFAADDPVYAELVDMEKLIADDNADGEGMAWLTTPAIAATMRITPKQGSGVEGNFILESGSRPMAGTLLDMPLYRTANMPTGYILLGRWSELLVGFWGGIELDADPYGSNFLKGSVTVRVMADIDINVRHPGAFCEGHNA